MFPTRTRASHLLVLEPSLSREGVRVVKRADHDVGREAQADELLLIYRLVSSAMESLVVYRCPKKAAVHLEAARRACLRIGVGFEHTNGHVVNGHD
jgi:hypothetical protein